MSAAALLRRVGTALATIIAVWLLVAGLTALVPGDPIDLMLGEQARPAAREALRARLNLDVPWPLRTVRGLADLARGELGQSIWLDRPVAALIGDRLGATAALAGAAFLVAWAVALPLGLLGGWYPGGRADRIGRALAVATWATPAFALGPLLLTLFAVRLSWFPLGGYATLSALVLPALTLGIGIAGPGLRLLRDGMATQRRSLHVRAAQARGVRGLRLLALHGLRPALAPVLQVAALQFGALLAGSVVVETIFRWPGLGRLLVQAISARDLPLVQGLVLVMCTAWIVVQALADLGGRRLDPRVGQGGAP
jgi:peptide/nickel transport system permease protein